MKDAHCNSISFAFSARRRLVLAMLAACIPFAPVIAAARCPLPKTEAQHIAEGAVVFSGRVRVVGPKQATGLPAYYDFDVVDSAERTLRVHTPDQAMYTASFEKGRLYRVVASRGTGGLSTYACVNKPL